MSSYRWVMVCAPLLVWAVTLSGCVAPYTGQEANPTPIPTLSPAYPPTDDVTEILRRWKAALAQTRAKPSLRIHQTITGVKADGSRAPIPDDFPHPTSTEEVHENLTIQHGRYHLVVHFALPGSKTGDLIMLYDGEHSYKRATWTNEVYRPYHDELCKREKPNEYCGDEYWETLETQSALYASYWSSGSEDYRFVGRHEFDGRRLVELNRQLEWLDGGEERIYLDESTYLPYRITMYGSGSPEVDVLRQRGYVGYERTFTKFELGASSSDADFSLELPANVVKVYDEFWQQPYTTTQQAAQYVDFTLFEPPSNIEPGETRWLDTPYIVEKDGKQSHVIRLRVGDLYLLQGIYMPAEAEGLYRLAGVQVPHGSVSTIDIDGQPAIVRRALTGGFHSLTFNRDGTTILIVGDHHSDGNNAHERELAIELARSLQPVKKSP